MSSSSFDDIILWFEHDLLDQLQILQILNWFYQNSDHAGTPSLICIDRFDGIEPFRGIGQLNAVQMASLFDQRRSVTAQQLGVAHAAWNAFCAPDPGALLDFIATDGDALPFLKPALRRHLQEFPWLNDGLTRTERQLLLLVKNGTTKPGQLFVKNMDLGRGSVHRRLANFQSYRVFMHLRQAFAELSFRATFFYPHIQRVFLPRCFWIRYCS